MGHLLIISQTVGIDLTLAQIIGDFKELSSTLSFSKFEGKLWKKFRSEKIDLSPTPTLWC